MVERSVVGEGVLRLEDPVAGGAGVGLVHVLVYILDVGLEVAGPGEQFTAVHATMAQTTYNQENL